MKIPLFLLSSSKSRIALLQEAQIQFQTLAHASAEDLSPAGKTPVEFVCAIAEDKMRTLAIPEQPDVTNEILVLTGDTLVFAADGEICAKPVDVTDAHRMFDKFMQASIKVITACCLKKFKREQDGAWVSVKTRTFFTQTELMYELPAVARKSYFEAIPNFLDLSGGAQVEGYGAQFVRWMHGSASAVQGLPMFELRQALEDILKD